MANSIKVGRFFGIEVKLHYSWFFIFALLAWALSTGFFPSAYPGLSQPSYWIIGIISSLLLFVSVLLHELSHSFVAKLNKINVDRITLFFFGGVAQIHETNITPKKELRMALAGPALSILLGLIFLAVMNLASSVYVTAVAFYLSRLNFILAGFNLIPGFPLDGGRVFRAIVWWMTGDIKKATKYASAFGKGFAVFLIATGVISMLVGSFSGLWLVILGFFLFFLAKMGYQQILIKEGLSNTNVNKIMRRDIKTVRPDLKLIMLLEYFLRHGQETFPVVKNNKFLGIVSLAILETIPKNEWAKKRIKDIMLKNVKTINSKSNAYSALMKMINQDLQILPVVDKNKLVGILERESLFNFINIKLEISNLKKK